LENVRNYFSSFLWFVLAVMDALADGLEHFHVNGSCTSVISIVLELCVASYPIGAFPGCESDGGPSRYAGNDCPYVEGEDGGIGVDGVGEQDFGEFERRQYWNWQVGLAAKGVFIWA
jgi:hypothetical protein